MPAKLDLCIGFSAPERDLYQNWVLILSTATSSNSFSTLPPLSTYYYTLNGQDSHGNHRGPENAFERFVTTATSFPAWPIDRMEKVCTVDAGHKKYVDKAASEGPTQNSQLYIALILERLGNYNVIPGEIADKWGERVDERVLMVAEFAGHFGDGTLGLTDEERESRWKEYNVRRGRVCRWSFAYLWQRRRWVAKENLRIKEFISGEIWSSIVIPSNPNTYYYIQGGPHQDPPTEFEACVDVDTQFYAWTIASMEKICSIDARDKGRVDGVVKSVEAKSSQVYVADILKELEGIHLVADGTAGEWAKRVDKRLWKTE